MKESAESLLQSIIDQKPLETQQIFDALVVDKLNTMLGDYKVGLAQDKFNGGEKEEESEVEADLSDEEIEELLSSLSDEDLQQMIADMEDENGSEDQETEFEDDEPEEIDTPEIEESKKDVRADLEKKMAEYKAKGGKITVGRTSKKKVAGGLREDAEELDETVTRKHFKLAADTIKSLPEDKRKEHAELHANMYAKENPRFNRAKFMQACGVKE